MKQEVSSLREMGCWGIVERPNDEKVMHTKYLLNMKRNEKSEVDKHKVRIVVRGNEQVIYQEEKFFSLASFFVVKQIVAFCIQRRWTAKLIEFKNAFRNGRLERPVYVKMSAHMLSKSKHDGTVFRL